MKRIARYILFFVLLFFVVQIGNAQNEMQISLNGKWLSGENQVYDREVDVPGIATDPSKVNKEKLWYKKVLFLPQGDWKYATLELKGARFLPEVYVNGSLVSKEKGGMATTFHLLDLGRKDVAPGKEVVIEIALSSLNDIKPDDASYIPPADQWRSNISSSLWDDVILHFHGECRIGKVVPHINIEDKQLDVVYYVDKIKNNIVSSGLCVVDIYNSFGQKLISKTMPFERGKNNILISYNNILEEWTPDAPHLYKLSISLYSKKRLIDRSEMNLGIKDFEIRNKQFFLNGKPCKLRGGTVVWHRWVRSLEGRELGYDTSWFLENIVQRLKDHGANYLRFHLGVPPERLLDLCDKYGLLVQYEWSFFHGMPASKESCVEQYEQWLNLAMKHPSIAIYHPYNETEGEQLDTVWEALNTILPDYPPLVLSERDVIHIHKYWWSLFENLGLYYDSYEQFDKAIMVDEFGGNYLDGEGNMGGYKSIPESYLRFLGHNHTAEMRLRHLALSNGKVAEYWRRIGAAGVSPFCIASSWEDGNTWFMGKLKEGKPKSVWNALTPLWSPLSVSLEVWDVNYRPKAKVELPVYLFNDTDREETFKVRITIGDKKGKIDSSITVEQNVGKFSTFSLLQDMQLPEKVGDYVIKAELTNRPTNIKYPVESSWDIRVFEALIPDKVKSMNIYIPSYETELLAFAKTNQLKFSSQLGKKSDVVLLSQATWDKLAAGDRAIGRQIELSISQGVSVVMLDVGNRNLGQGYPTDKNNLGPLQGVARVTDPSVTNYDLFGGIVLTFKEAAEPETNFFADLSTKFLWNNLPDNYSGMWNGLRGGLTVPASDMEMLGLNQAAFLKQWKARGADIEKIASENYFAYELQGFYEFSILPKDQDIQKKLRAKVVFLVEDAPALASSINPNSPIKITNLSEEYKKAKNGIAENLIVLANAGKNLTRSPVMMIDFGEEKGKLIVSQLLTAGRMCDTKRDNNLYEVRYDETAVQILLNMLDLAIEK